MYRIEQFPKTRVATLDIGRISKSKHYVPALIELDVTNLRETIKIAKKKQKLSVSFTAVLVSLIAQTLKKHAEVASFLKSKRQRIIFEDINISVLVEKKQNNQQIPIPLLLEKTQDKTVFNLTQLLTKAKNSFLSEDEIVLHKNTNWLEQLYPYIPQWIRLLLWKIVLKSPKTAFKKMGNVSYTSIGMLGNINGWFIPTSIHPICFGVSDLQKKPMVVDGEIKIRELLKMTVLMDHDVVDGGAMVRFISDLTKVIEKGTIKI